MARIALVIVCASASLATANDDVRRPAIGVATQVYPAGVIAALEGRWRLADHHEGSAFAGVNLTDRQDFGEHDDESGEGSGPGLAWRYRFSPRGDTWDLGARVDLWWLEIDWEDDGGREGTTDVVVLQPTAVGGYRWLLDAEDRWSLDATAALGAEINVDTDGEDVGEGAILLLGVHLGYRL